MGIPQRLQLHVLRGREGGREGGRKREGGREEEGGREGEGRREREGGRGWVGRKEVYSATTSPMSKCPVQVYILYIYIYI